jgi:photosystem II stability/assembly factor-like uncharacterized protein
MHLQTIVYLVSMLLLQSVPHWTTQTSGVNARLRGVSAVSDNVAWASGSGATVLRTSDGGATWQKLHVTSDQIDFRDIDAIDSQTAYILSIGNGPDSRIYKTTDSGASWKLQFKNDDPKAFLDAMSFWDADHGIVFGDSIEGQFYVLITSDGGSTWSRVPATSLPHAQDNEGAFAASGTNIALFGKTHAWIGTGAAGKSRVLRTADRGKTWTIADTPIKSGASEGIFSIAFRDAKHGIVVGGDYRKENEAVDNAAITKDGGATWQLIKGLRGFRSVVAYVPGLKRTLVAIGPSGGDISTDDGNTWSPIDVAGSDTFSFAPGRSTGWGAGAKGNLGKLSFEKK